MSAPASRLSALDAAIAAVASDAPLRIMSLAPSKDAPDSPSLALLWRIQQGCGQASPLIVQVAPCEPHEDGSFVARGLAQAALAAIGRTLLVDVQDRTVTRSLETHGASPRPIRQSLTNADLCGLLVQQRAPVRSVGQGYAAIMINQIASARCDAACGVAALCSGTVLIAHKGVTTIAALRVAAARISAAGGLVLGVAVTGA